jgi:TatD DNase family protein
MLLDTHAHLDFPDYDEDRVDVLDRANAAGVTEIITIGTRLDTSYRATELASNFPAIWCTVGIHPNEVAETPDPFIDSLRALAAHPRVVALGEIGLDYHHLPSRRVAGAASSPPPEPTPSDAALQQRQATFFRLQLDLAVELGLNVVIHQRDAWEDTLAILHDYRGRLRGVFHCFGGTAEQAAQVLRDGHLVSFTGIITFRNAAIAQATAAAVPAGSFMVETDCPYLAPHPHRGKRCEPAHTRLVAEKMAQLRGTTLEQVATETTQTARDFFHFARGGGLLG